MFATRIVRRSGSLLITQHSLIPDAYSHDLMIEELDVPAPLPPLAFHHGDLIAAPPAHLPLDMHIARSAPRRMLQPLTLLWVAALACTDASLWMTALVPILIVSL